MTDYTLALFAHILGALGLFMGIGLDWATILRLRRAQTVAQVREQTSLLGVQTRLLQLSLLLLLVAGIYMTATVWEGTPWIIVSLVSLFVIGGLGGGLIDRRLKAIQRAAAGERSSEAIPAALQAQIVDPVLWTAFQVVGFIALGVVFVMTTKPDWLVSLITLVVAIILGVLVAQLGRPRPAAALEGKPGAAGQGD